jgi:hypothetical protein
MRLLGRDPSWQGYAEPSYYGSEHPADLWPMQKRAERRWRKNKNKPFWDPLAAVETSPPEEARAPALVFPLFHRDGRREGVVVRLFNTKKMTYCQPNDSLPFLYFWPGYNWMALPAGTVVVLVEGIFKAVYLCQCGIPALAIQGMTSWQSKKKGIELIEAFAEVAPLWRWLLLPDSDDLQNPSVNGGTARLAAMLTSRGATVLGVGHLPLRRDAAGNYVKNAPDDLGPDQVAAWYEQQLYQRPVVELEKYRYQLLARRIGMLNKPGVGLDHSGTGSGKTQAEITVIKVTQAMEGRRSLVLLPTHNQCQEFAADAAGELLDAVPYLELNENTCRRFDEADLAMKHGMSPGVSLCPTCPYQGECPNYNAVREATQAQTAVGTQQRAVHTLNQVAEHRQYVAVHESPLDLLRPQLKASKGFLPVEQLALETAKMLHQKDAGAYRSFYRDMARIARQLHGLVNSGEESHEVEIPRPALATPPKDYQGPLFETLTTLGTRFPGDAMRLVLACARGDIEQLQLMVDEEHRKRKNRSKDATEHKQHKAPAPVKLVRCLAGIQKMQLPPDANISVADATTTVALLAAALDKPVTDMTPRGKLKLHHPVLQILQDVKIGTRDKKAAAILRGILHDLPQYHKVGVITHRRLAQDLKRLIGASYAGRLVRVEHFGGGFSRGANVWFKECDSLIVLGTPRVPPQAVRAQLQRLRRVAASLFSREVVKAMWQTDWWSGVTQSGKRVAVPVKHYCDHDWHMAHHSLVIAELVQAIGRARSILPDGIPCYVVTRENLSPLERGMEGHEDYRISDRPFGPLSETQGKVLQVLAGPGHWSAEGIARRVGLTRQTVLEHLGSLKEAGRVRLVSRMKGWQEVRE